MTVTHVVMQGPVHPVMEINS